MSREALVAHRLGALEAVAPVPGEGLVDEGDDLEREVGRDARDRGRRGRRRQDERLVVGAPLVQALAAHHGVERGADGEQVGAAVDAVGEAHGLLRRHERGRAQRGPGARRLAAGLAHAGHAEVEQLDHVLAGDEDVGRLDVAVDDALVVEALERVAELGGDPQRLVGGDLAVLALPELLGGLAFEQLHHQEGLARLGDAVVVDGDAAAVVDLVGDVPLLEEAVA